jgi:hypothetical protein
MVALAALPEIAAVASLSHWHAKVETLAIEPLATHRRGNAGLQGRLPELQ